MLLSNVVKLSSFDGPVNVSLVLLPKVDVDKTIGAGIVPATTVVVGKSTYSTFRLRIDVLVPANDLGAIMDVLVAVLAKSIAGSPI